MDRLNQWLTLTANLGVIVGIVFLAYEIQVNTNATQSSTYASWNEGAQSWGDFVADNATTLALVRTKKVDELTPDQLFVVIGYATKTFNQSQAAFLHHRAGSLPDEVMEAHLRGLVQGFEAVPVLRNVWRDSMRNVLAPSFVDYMERRVEGL